MGDYDMKVTVESDPIRIGANPQPPNVLKISIENRGGKIEQARPVRAVRIHGRLGSDPDALFLNPEDCKKCSLRLDGSPDWDPGRWAFGDDGSFRLELNRYADVLFEQGEMLTLSLTDLLSRTATGAASLTVTLGPAEAPALWEQQNIQIRKEEDFTGINCFYSEPAELDEHDAGTSVTLHWLTSNLEKRRLLRNAVEVPGCDFEKAQGSKEVGVGQEPVVTFTLEGTETKPGGGRKTARLTLNVVLPGWHDVQLELSPGDRGYAAASEAGAAPKVIKLFPTLVAIAPDNMLWGVFRCRDRRRDHHMLFQTTNPLGGWTLVDERFPLAFATSPAVISGGRLWLVGGSRIQQEQTSNRLCCYDLERLEWSDMPAQAEDPAVGPMPARMGHGVVWFDDRIWVMGGRDAGGNALDDVWTFDPKAETPVWRRETEHAGWSPRCLISPIVFDKKIWLFGGAEEPDSNNLFADIWCGDGKSWLWWGTPGFLGRTGLATLGGALQVMNGKLMLLGKCRQRVGKDADHESFLRRLDSPSSRTWSAPLPAENLADWGSYVTFACTLIGWSTDYPTGGRTSHLLALALGPDDDDYANTKPMKLYLA
jgi:hypothetical protein